VAQDPEGGAAAGQEGGESDALRELIAEVARAPARDPAALGADLRAGAVVGRFELLRELGRGGFGVVFEARDRDLGRLVAFKAMRRLAPERAGELARPLREEAEAAARLNHPNIVTLHDYGIHGGTPYLILERLQGETLQRRLAREGKLPPPEAIRIALDVARGLVHAHAQGVVHRDLKPGNVFLCADGGTKLLDFGLARLVGRAGGDSGGTPAYMAPEQFRGEEGDARTDVFAAAVVLWHALTGQLPFAAAAGRSAALDPGPPPRLPLADAPPELAALLAAALSKDPAGRPQTAQALLDALQAVARAYQRRAEAALRASRRRRVRRALVAAALAIASGAAALAQRARTEAERALRASRIAAAADAASDPLVAALLLAELPGTPPPRAFETAQRVLRQPIPAVVLRPVRGGHAFAVSPDGRLVAAGLRGGIVRLFRTDGAGAPRELGTPGERRIDDLAFTPDGARLVAARHDGVVLVLDPVGEAAPRTLPAGDAPVARLALSPDGRTAAIGALDGRAWIVPLDGRSPSPLLHGADVREVAFDREGRRLATGTSEGEVRAFDAATGAQLWSAPLPGGAVAALAFTPDGRRLLVAWSDGTVRLLDGARGAVVGMPAEPGAGAARAALSPDGGRVAVARRDGTAAVLDLDGRRTPVRLGAPDAPLAGVAFSPDGGRVLAWTMQGSAWVAPADGGSPPLLLPGHLVMTAAFTPDGTRIVTRGTDGALRVWPAADPRDRGVLRGHTDLVDTVQWSGDGMRILTASHDGTARIWSLEGGATSVLRDPGRSIHSAQFDPAERRIVTASQDGAVRVWRVDGGVLLTELRGHDGAVLQAAFSPDGRSIASASLDQTVRVWPADGAGAPQVLRGHEAAPTRVVWTPDGRSLVTASQLDGTVRVWPVDGGAPRTLAAENSVFDVKVSPDGTRIGVAETDGAFRLFRLSDLRELPAPPGRPDGMWALAWRPDGRVLALGANDGTVRIVSADGHGDPEILRGHASPITQAAFAPDGTLLATASADGTARVWLVSWPKLQEALRGASSACLPVTQRTAALGEPPDEARARFEACERGHGRTPTPVPAPPHDASVGAAALRQETRG